MTDEYFTGASRPLATSTDEAFQASGETDYPDPLVPGWVILTDFPFMPLYVRKLLNSEFWIKAMITDPRVAAATINLLAEAWHQTPASSLPTDDAILARYAMLEYRTWVGIRAAVMAPWVRANDGRWYHPVLAEIAQESWKKKRDSDIAKRKFSERQSYRSKRRWSRDRDESSNSGRNADRIANIRESDSDTESDSDNLPSSKELSGNLAAMSPDHHRTRREYPDDFQRWWALYPVKKDKASAYKAFVIARRKIGIDGLHKGLERYMADHKATMSKTPHPRAATWLIDQRWEDGA